jgi:hypothetical protein
VLLVLLMRDGDGRGQQAAASRTAATSTTAASSTAASSTATEPTETTASSTPAAGELTDPASPDFAASWVQSLVDGDGDTAFGQLCRDGQDQLQDATTLQSDFEAFVGGPIQTGSVTDAVGAEGDDYVTFDTTLEGGGQSQFAIIVVQEGGGPTVCGWIDPADIP